MNEAFENLLEERLAVLDPYADLREILLANGVMFGEIPSPTAGEERRVRFMADRLNEVGLVDINIDEVGNGLGRIPGKTGKRNILLVAQADTVFSEKVDHAMAVETGKVVGPSIANNSLGLAAITVLPTILEKLGLEFDADLYLLGAARSLGRGNLEGLRFFLENFGKPIHQGVCVESVHLGRLSYASLGMLRAEISVQAPEETAWHHFGRISAARILTKTLNRLYAIPIPREPKTSINIGTVETGQTYSDMTTSGHIRLEVRSEEATEVARIKNIIEELVLELAQENRLPLHFEVIAERDPGGIPFSHPLVKTIRSILHRLDIEPRIAPSVGNLSALIAKGIPALTLGLTDGENLNKTDETVFIEPLPRGLAQLITLLCAIDKGFCDEEN